MFYRYQKYKYPKSKIFDVHTNRVRHWQSRQALNTFKVILNFLKHDACYKNRSKVCFTHQRKELICSTMQLSLALKKVNGLGLFSAVYNYHLFNLKLKPNYFEKQCFFVIIFLTKLIIEVQSGIGVLNRIVPCI